MKAISFGNIDGSSHYAHVCNQLAHKLHAKELRDKTIHDLLVAGIFTNFSGSLLALKEDVEDLVKDADIILFDSHSLAKRFFHEGICASKDCQNIADHINAMLIANPKTAIKLQAGGYERITVSNAPAQTPDKYAYCLKIMTIGHANGQDNVHDMVLCPFVQAIGQQPHALQLGSIESCLYHELLVFEKELHKAYVTAGALTPKAKANAKKQASEAGNFCAESGSQINEITFLYDCKNRVWKMTAVEKQPEFEAARGIARFDLYKKACREPKTEAVYERAAQYIADAMKKPN